MTAQFNSGADAIAALREIPADDLAATITWVDRFVYSVFEPHLGIASMSDWQTIAQNFNERGYQANANCGEAFVESDATNHGIYVIGQFVALLEAPGNPLANAMSQHVRQCCSDWTRVFAGSSN